MTMMINVSASTSPISGDQTMNTPILRSPSPMMASKPALATAAPTIPPTNACDDDDGNPRIAVTTFQTIAPTSPAKITPIDNTL